MYYINIFYIYSIIGYIYEILICLLLGNKLESGFLYGPWTPIYGIGVIIMLILSTYLFKKLKLKKWIEVIIFLLLIILILTILEFCAGHLLEFIFNKEFWNYSNLKFHIGKYIALEVSLIWGIMSIIVIYIINPFIDKFIKRISKIVTYVLTILFILDLILTLVNKL